MNKEIIEKYMDEVWNNRNFGIIHEVFADTAVIHSPLGKFQSPSEMSETVKKWITAIPDIHVELMNTVEENGLVVSHWKAKGKHQGTINDIQAQGNPVEYRGVSIYRMEDGKVVEYWAYLDSWTLEQQMNL
jgi:steroid delta-isomerase-like uncharacterized protein